MNDTLIGWTDDTKNLWWGCKEVNPQCDNCYARVFDKRLGGDHWHATGPRLIQPGVWESFRKTQALAAKQGKKRTQFVQSMSDIFERAMPLVDKQRVTVPDMDTADLRNRLFRSVVPNSPNLVFLLLTKRPQNIEYMIPQAWLTNPPDNVWYGASVGTGNDKLDQRNVDALVAIPGKHFLSAEPLLGELHVDLSDIEWLIVGGESGAHARPSKLEWFTDARERCGGAGIPFFMKQTGAVLAKQYGYRNTKGESLDEWPEALRVQQFPVW